ncbi:MAG: hypothetical protein JJU29_17290 [Verrucomicrobia bacterium]|nr:hypothetical protein [Verrucomicrobiota bacterium]MCH8513038.1 hypothetical protein [Kiritimatiellia bacterium]
MIEAKPKFSPAYKGALALVVTQQVLLWLLTGVVLTGGVLESILFFALTAYWVGFVMIVARRPDNPTKTDIFLIKWGTFLLFPVSFFMSIGTSKILEGM